MENGDKLFRMNFIIQDNSLMTLDANLIRIVESIILDKGHKGLTLEQIKDNILLEYELDFSEEEISKALNKKGRNIQKIEEKYHLKPEYRSKLEKRDDFTSQINKLIIQAIHECQLDVSAHRYQELIKKYLYYCFNSNKNSILSLINHTEVVDEKFSNDPDDIKLINTFLNWKNEEKDKLVTNVVSFGYIYCSLTVKKDDLLSNKLFRGKKFILDANIIFRLAGINNDSRKRTIKSFADKCKEVGVELCYTTATLDEIKRVIINKVKWIKSVTGEQRPLDVTTIDNSENDFYSIYCSWSADSVNQYNDFKAFERYLTRLVMEVLDQLTCLNSVNYEVKKKSEFDSYVLNLNAYKEKHSAKKQTQASLKTDVSNVLYIKELRSNSANENIWSTNVFLISADQNLIKWSLDVESGIPLIVLPSVWLTILLRFSGRTSDDYKAFCSFLELRTHQEESEIDVYSLLKNLATKTDNNELKQLIVKEVFDNKEEYVDIASDDCEAVVEKAYDIISERRQEQFDLKFENIKQQNDEKEKQLQDYEIQLVADNEFKIAKLVDADAKKHFKFVSFIDRNKKIVGFVIFVILIIDTVLALTKKGLIFCFLKCVFPDTVNGTGNCLSALGIIWAIVVVLGGFIACFISYLSSENVLNKYKEKRKEYYEKLFDVIE